MHVLIVPSWYPTADSPILGGFFRDQALALSSAGMKVGVISPWLRSLKHFPQAKKTWTKKRTVYDDNDVLTYCANSWNWSYKLKRLRAHHWLLLGRQLFKEYISEQGLPHVIHAQSALLGGLLAYSLSEKYGIPFIVTEHSTRFSRELVSDYEKGLCARVFNKSNKNLAVSPSLAHLLSTLFPSVSQPWQWLPNCLDHIFEQSSIFNEESMDDSSVRRARNNEKQGEIRFLNIGMLTPKKGQDFLIRTFSSSFGTGSSVELIIGGDGPIREQLEKTIAETKMRKTVRLLGPLSKQEVLKEMLDADVFVLPSHHETFGVVLIEALACGKPVIATACGGPECIVTPDNGLLIEAGNTKQLSDALRYMQQNLSRYSAPSLRQECLNRFSSASLASRLREIYDDVL
ncbi:MAG: glycosyltransferase [Cyanobacteria bacterium J06560_5]